MAQHYRFNFNKGVYLIVFWVSTITSAEEKIEDYFDLHNMSLIGNTHESSPDDDTVEKIAQQNPIMNPDYESPIPTILLPSAQDGVVCCIVNLNWIITRKKITRNPLTDDAVFKNWALYCDAQLGCLSLTPAWFNLLRRPINMEPWPRDRIFTEFSLYTREVPNMRVYLYANDTSTITGSTFNVSRPTKVITHGFWDNGYEDFIMEIVSNLLINGDYNVIVTHWGPGSGNKFSDYFQAVANSRVVGLEMAYLVNTLVSKLFARAEDFHLIGHSLGAHVCGYAGQSIPNLGRITGLDPAGHLFSYMDPIVRLDPTDATFVDTLHTGAGLFGVFAGGSWQSMGHADIYVNGGYNQPGCDGLSNSTSMLCSHNRAWYLFRDFLISSCQPVAYECSDYNSFKQGECFSCGSDNSRCVPVGVGHNLFPTKRRTNVRLFLATSGSSPYCQYQYVIKTRIADDSLVPENLNGVLSISMFGDGGFSNNVQLIDHNQPRREYSSFTRGQEQSFLITSSIDLGRIESISLSWTSRSNKKLNMFCKRNNCSLYVASVTIFALNHYPEEERLNNSYIMCPVSNASYTVIQSSLSANLIAKTTMAEICCI